LCSRFADILIIPPLDKGGVAKAPLSLIRERVGVRVSIAKALILITLILTFSLEGRRNDTFYDTL